MFNTTRCGYGVSANSYVDAIPEVWAKYKAWQEEQGRLALIRRRNEKAKELREVRNRLKMVASLHEVPYGKTLSLRKKYPYKLDSLLQILLSTRIRSGFKLSIREQIVNWLKDPNPKYQTPLSRRQLDFI